MLHLSTIGVRKTCAYLSIASMFCGTCFMVSIFYGTGQISYKILQNLVAHALLEIPVRKPEKAHVFEN